MVGRSGHICLQLLKRRALLLIWFGKKALSISNPIVRVKSVTGSPISPRPVAVAAGARTGNQVNSVSDRDDGS